MTRFLFVCYPDINTPIGGVKQIYRQVSLLNELGFDAFVLHQEPGFRVSWFESKANVIDIQSYVNSGPCASTDIIVLPETWVSNIPHYLVGIKKVIFNQNAFYTFGLDGNFDPMLLQCYKHDDVLAVVTVSEDNRNFLVDGCSLNASNVFTLLNGIDANLFHPSVKARRIVFLERKFFIMLKLSLYPFLDPPLPTIAFDPSRLIILRLPENFKKPCLSFYRTPFSLDCH